MKKLTTQKHWNDIYLREQEGQKTVWKKFISSLKSIFGESANNYSEYQLWNGIYKKYLPQTPGLKIVEIGSAPGWNLVKFKEEYGYNPFGIEYSEAGAENNRRRFARKGIDPNQVIIGDFFADEISRDYSSFFDIVLSGGFIEHFDNTDDVISRHIDILKKDGLLIITIPNFQGINKMFAKFFDKEIQVTHNFNIMNKDRFEELFENKNLEKVYCDYYGTLYLGMFNPAGGKAKYIIYRFLVRLQVIFNIIFHALFGTRSVEHAYISPYLIYIGRKK